MRRDAATPPTRDAPVGRSSPRAKGGLFPRTLRTKLRDGDPFEDISEFDAATVDRRVLSPILGTAVHYHHMIREDLRPKLDASAGTRFYEEDPWTHRFLARCPLTILPNQSRFEFDANRPPDTTVYATPELAWGIKTWSEPLSQYEREFTLEKWYEFHTFIDAAVEDAIERFGFAIVLDMHSYNYQRSGPTDWRTDGKPVVNLGTKHLRLDPRGKRLVDDFMTSLRGTTVQGEACLVEENGVFYGGYLNRRLSHLYGPRCITLSVEYKKVFMDERSHTLYPEVLVDLVAQFDDALGALAEAAGAPLAPYRSIPDPVAPLQQTM